MKTIPTSLDKTPSTPCRNPGSISNTPDRPASLSARRVDTTPGVRPAVTDGDWHQAQTLLRDYAVWIGAVIGADLATEQPEFGRELIDLANVYRPPGGTLLVAHDGCGICGMVALRIHGHGSAELKRLYVRPAARGAGWADRLLAEAIRRASRLGASRIWLETLPGPMDPAITLYRRHGFDTARRRPTVALDGLIVMERGLHA